MIAAIHLITLLCILYLNCAAAAVQVAVDPESPILNEKGTTRKSKSPLLQLKDMFLLSNSMVDWSSSETLLYNNVAENYGINVASSSSSSSAAETGDKNKKMNKGQTSEPPSKLDIESKSAKPSILDTEAITKSGDPEIVNTKTPKTNVKDNKGPLDNIGIDVTSAARMGAEEAISTKMQRLVSMIHQEPADGQLPLLSFWFAFGLASIFVVIAQVQHHIAKSRPKIKIKNWRAKVNKWNEEEVRLMKEVEAKRSVEKSGDEVEEEAMTMEPNAENSGCNVSILAEESGPSERLVLETQQKNKNDEEEASSEGSTLKAEDLLQDLVAKFKNEEENKTIKDVESESKTEIKDRTGDISQGQSDDAFESLVLETKLDMNSDAEDENENESIESILKTEEPLNSYYLNTKSKDEEEHRTEEDIPVELKAEDSDECGDTLEQKADPFKSLVFETKQKMKEEEQSVESALKVEGRLTVDNLVAKFKIEGENKIAKKIERAKAREELSRLSSQKTAKMVADIENRLKAEEAVRAKVKKEKDLSMMVKMENEARIHAEAQKKLDLERSAAEARIKAQQENARMKAEEEAKTEEDRERLESVDEPLIQPKEEDISCWKSEEENYNKTETESIAPDAKAEEAMSKIQANIPVDAQENSLSGDDDHSTNDEQDFSLFESEASMADFAKKQTEDTCIKNEAEASMEVDEVFGTWEIEDELACIEDDAEADWLNAM